MLNSYIRHRMADRKMDDVIELMRMTGLSRNTVNKLFHEEKIKTLKIETLIRVCDALDCSLKDLIEYTPDPQ